MTAAETGTVAIVGAGVAGLACARALADGGLPVALFDKGRAPGGRVATRRTPQGSFDHGAQYATARGGGFSAVIEAMARQGAAAPWPAAGGDRWVGVPGMSAIGRHLAEGLTPLRLEHTVTALAREPGGWVLRLGDAREGPFATLVVAIPAPQAAGLLAGVGDGIAARLADVAIAPCWAVMAAFGDRLDLPDLLRPEAGPLGWAAREASRPGRAAEPDRFVLHATAAWSRAHLEASPGVVGPALLDALGAAAARPIHLAAHRWRHAKVERALGEPCVWDAALRLGLCGDFCLGPRVEAAWDSGAALAHAILGR